MYKSAAKACDLWGRIPATCLPAAKRRVEGGRLTPPHLSRLFMSRGALVLTSGFTTTFQDPRKRIFSSRFLFLSIFYQVVFFLSPPSPSPSFPSPFLTQTFLSLLFFFISHTFLSFFLPFLYFPFFFLPFLQTLVLFFPSLTLSLFTFLPLLHLPHPFY